MMFRKHRSLAPAAAIPLMLAATATFAFPGPTACAVVGFAGMHSLADGFFTDSGSQESWRQFTSLVQEARARIEATFGATESRPIVVFFEGARGFGPFQLNGYGSTQMIGSRACVLVGPSGQNVDVVAHELMHAELHHRTGPLARLLEVPTWFDEGVAMQVDYRRPYWISSQASQDADRVRTLTTSSSFSSDDDQALTQNYAFAKAVMAAWTDKAGAHTLYDRLRELKQGRAFGKVFPEHEFSYHAKEPTFEGAKLDTAGQ
jgi:hypothetical protein